MATAIETIDDYVAPFPSEVQAVLEEIRRRVRDVAPDGEEVISYGMPTVRVNGRNLVHFAGWKKHVSLYPAPELADPELAAEVAPYESSRGTLQFPLNRPIPYDLITRLVRLLLAQRG